MVMVEVCLMRGQIQVLAEEDVQLIVVLGESTGWQLLPIPQMGLADQGGVYDGHR